MLAEGTRAVVTGASRGIGLAVARALRGRASAVAMVARSRGPLEQAAAQIGGTAFAADVGNPAAAELLVEQLLGHFGDAPDIVINAAGAFGLAPVAETTARAFDDMLAANLRGPFVLMRAFLPRMLERGSGHIVSIGSVAGRFAFPGNGAYSASKFGLRGLHEALGHELRGTGVRSTLIEPAATDTALWDGIDYAANPGLPDRSQMLSPDAVAETVMFALDRPNAVVVQHMGIERS